MVKTEFLTNDLRSFAESDVFSIAIGHHENFVRRNYQFVKVFLGARAASPASISSIIENKSIEQNRFILNPDDEMDRTKRETGRDLRSIALV
jgi:hypothetical protein